jgi:uncharacterized OB-fold protein
MNEKEQQALVKNYSLKHTRFHQDGNIVKPKCPDCGRNVFEQQALVDSKR